MDYTSLTSKINWRLIVVHFIAGWLIMIACKYLAFLFDIQLLEEYSHANKEQLYKNMDLQRMAYYTLFLKVAPIAGLIIASCVSFIIVYIKQRSVINYLFITSMLIGLILLGIWEIEGIYLPVKFFKNYITSFTLICLLNAVLYAGSAAILYFSKAFTRFTFTGSFKSSISPSS